MSRLGEDHGTTLTPGSLPPLVLPAIALGCGIAAGDTFPEISFLVWGSSLVLGVGAISIIKEPLGILPAALFFVLGHGLISLLIQPDLPHDHVAGLCNRGRVWVEGRIASVPEQHGQRVRFDLAVERAGQTREERFASRGKVRLSIYYCSRDLRFGDPIGCQTVLKPIRNFNNPGGFDYTRYMGLRKIHCSGWAKAAHLVCLPRTNDPEMSVVLVNRVYNYRSRFASYIRKTVKNQDAAAVLTALVTGDRSAISRELKTVFARSGAGHILAISGLHLSIVAFVAFQGFIRLFSLWPPLLIPGYSRKLAAVLTLVPLVLYALLSGFSASTRRALMMIVVVMVSHVMEKEADTLNSLAAAFIVILLVEPGALFSVSFQLSFVAVLFIVGGMSLARGRGNGKTPRPSLLHKVGMFAMISACAILGTQPLVMHYFNQVSFAGILTNFVLIPGAGFMAVPLGLFALVFYPVSVPLSGFLLTVAGWILGPCIWLLRWVSSISLFWARTVTPDLCEICCYYLVFAGGFIMVKGCKKTGGAVMVAALVILGASEAVWIKQRFFNRALSVFVLDVGQGSAALIEMPQGRRVLVDGGGFSRSSNFDPGEHLVAPFLRRRKILTLDAVILTHPESDHMNGFIYIMENFKVGRFIKNGDQGSSASYKALMAVVAKRGVRVDTVPDLDRLDFGGTSLEFLYPLVSPGAGRETTEALNNNSIVFKLIHGKTGILFPGDLLAQGEQSLVIARGERLASTILIAPHHGSSSSSSDFFLDQVAPKSVIISCGWRNRYGFPHASVVKRYRKRGCNLFRTDRSGAVRILCTASGCRILTLKGE
ncbi:MAG: DNA internalization-related competence protein ComEC/Rec2 [Desulfobacterium sp.]|nr:DNA internalization-related competence protein ComEC/Rec2 [Desulfobacterium sp.]